MSNNFSTSNDGTNSFGANFIAPTGPETSNDLQRKDIIRVAIPNIDSNSSPWNTAEELAAETDNRLRLLSRAVASAGLGSSGAGAAVNQSGSGQSPNSGLLPVEVPKNVRPFWEEYDDDRIAERLSGVLETILETFPIQQPRTIAFVGLDNEKALDEVTAEVAQLLVRRRIGKVLLVDGNVNSGALSIAAGAAHSEGLLEALQSEEPWQSHLQTGAASGLEFLPIGRGTGVEPSAATIQAFLQSLRDGYQFSCISLGNYDSPVASALSSFCDGAFLLVDVANASQTIAKSAVAALNTGNNKLLGCIAIND